MSSTVRSVFTLRSDKYESEIALGFQRVREAGDLFNVTFVCDGGEAVGHKALLAALSPYFQRVFRENPVEHPRLDHSEIKLDYLQYMLDFVYNGEVDIPQHEFMTFCNATDVFQIKGIYKDPADIPSHSIIKSEPPDESEGNISSTAATITRVGQVHGLNTDPADIPIKSEHQEESEERPATAVVSPVPGRGAVGADTAAGRMASSVATPAPAGRVNVSMSPARFGNFVSLLSGSGANVSIGLAPAVEVASTRAARSNAAAAGASSGAARSTAAASGSCAAAAVSTTAAAAAAATTAAAAAAATTTTGAAAAAAMAAAAAIATAAATTTDAAAAVATTTGSASATLAAATKTIAFAAASVADASFRAAGASTIPSADTTLRTLYDQPHSIQVDATRDQNSMDVSDPVPSSSQQTNRRSKRSSRELDKEPPSNTSKTKPIRKASKVSKELVERSKERDNRSIVEPRSKHEQIMYDCDQCSFKTKWKSRLSDHKQAKHEGIVFDCDQCSFKTNWKCHLSIHKQSKHEKIVFDCDQCSFKAKWKSNLSEHKGSKHKQIEVNCEQCSYKSNSKSSLSRHRRRKHKECHIDKAKKDFGIARKGKLD